MSDRKYMSALFSTLRRSLSLNVNATHCTSMQQHNDAILHARSLHGMIQTIEKKRKRRGRRKERGRRRTGRTKRRKKRKRTTM